MPDNFELVVKLDNRAIRSLANTVDMQSAMTTLGYFTEGEAKLHSPVRTGNLRRSIYSEVQRDGAGWFARVGTNVKYGFFQEVGTINHPPHPFLRPAVAALQTALRQGRF